MRTWSVMLVLVSLGVSTVALGGKSEAEKAKQKAERKLQSFTREYDPAKRLARKGAELEKDIAELDKELDALTTLDAAAGAELKAQRDAAVSAAREAVGTAAAGQTEQDLEKKLARIEQDFDPERKNLLNAEPKAIEKAFKELDELIAKLDGAAKTSWQAKRDAAYGNVATGITAAKVDRLRNGVEAPSAVAPAKGIEAIAPMTPTWCDGVLDFYGDQLRSMTARIPTEWEGKLQESILFSCLDPEWDVRQRVMAAYRQKLSNALGLTAAQNERLLQLGARLIIDDKKEKELVLQLCTQQLKVIEGTASERANRVMERVAVGCGQLNYKENVARLIDLDTPAGLSSQLAMAGLIGQVLSNPMDESDAVRLGAASDVAVLNTLPLDPVAFEKELAALQLNVPGEARARLAYFGARAKLLEYAATFRRLSPKIAGLEKMVFDAPTQAAKNYVAKQAAADKPLLDFVLSMEAQPGPIKGCAQKAWPFFVEALKPQSKAKVEEVRVPGLLAWALAECAARDPSAPAMEPIFTYYAERSTAVRGPLTAAYLASVDAYNDAAGAAKNTGFDETKRGGAPGAAPRSLPQPGDNPIGEAPLTGSLFGHANALDPERVGGSGVVKAVEKKGETVRIVFRTEKFMVPDFKCVETNRIDRIASDGTILYRRNCTKTGEHEESATLEPVEVPSWAAGGVGPGNTVVLYWMAINSGAPGRAFVVEAFDSKARAKRTSLFGVAQ